MLDLLTYDVFTDTAFRGNPLAIITGADALTDAQMQTLARELNLSETIFVMAPENPNHTAKVRIFFPTAEIPFAGHPTIGCAIHLSRLTDTDADARIDMVLEEVAGPVPVRVTKTGGRITAQFTAPVLPTHNRATETTLTAQGLGLTPADIGNALAPTPEVWQAGPAYLLVPIASLDALARARPSGADWQHLTDRAGTISAWLFAPDGANGIRARMFSPEGGTPEDPATGSAVVTFAGLFAQQGHCTAPETHLHITQGVEMGRRSDIEATLVAQNGTLTAVRIAGQAVHISTGRIRCP